MKSNDHQVDPLRILVAKQLEGTFRQLVPALADHITAQVRKSFQIIDRPVDPTRARIAPRKTADGLTLRTLRREAGMTQHGLAKLLGISQTMISRMELGKDRVPPETLTAIRFKIARRSA